MELSDAIRQRVIDFLEFIEDDTRKSFPMKCWEIKQVKDELQVSELYELLRDARYNFQGRVIRTPNKSTFYKTVNLFRENTISFREVIDMASLIWEIKYSDFIEILHNTRNKDWVTFQWIQWLLSKLEDPSKTTERNLLWIRELDIIALISINDNSAWDQSELILKLASIFWVTPDESLVSKVETLKKRTP